LAKNCGVSPDTLCRHFQQTTGKTVGDWLANERLNVAIVMLAKGDTVKETSFRLGYQHPTNFARKFKLYWKMSPTDFQNSLPLDDQNAAK